MKDRTQGTRHGGQDVERLVIEISGEDGAFWASFLTKEGVDIHEAGPFPTADDAEEVAVCIVDKIGVAAEIRRV